MSGGAESDDIVSEKNEFSPPFVDSVVVSKCCCPNSFYPWAKKSVYEPSMDGLNEQIKHFVDWVAPTAEERIMREDVCKRIEQVVTQIWTHATVETIGSTCTNLCVPTSDIDMVIFGVNFADEQLTLEKEESSTCPPDRTIYAVRTECLYKLAKNLEKISQKNSIEVLETARVPIVKMRDRKSGVEVDISFGVCSGRENTKVVLEYCEKYPLVRPLALMIKYYLKQKFLNNSWSGGIGSYTLVIMIISYLQLHAKKDKDDKVEEESLADHLLGFFALYGTQFDYEESVISILNGGKYLKKVDKNWINERNPHLLSVEDPHNPENDVGSIAFKIESVKEVFSQAYHILSLVKAQSSCPVDVDESISHNMQTDDYSRHPEFTLSQLFWVNYSLQCFRQRIKDIYRSPDLPDDLHYCPVHPNSKCSPFSISSLKFYNNGVKHNISSNSSSTKKSKKNKKSYINNNSNNSNHHHHHHNNSNNKINRNILNGTAAESHTLFGRNTNWRLGDSNMNILSTSSININSNQQKVYRIVNSDFPGLARANKKSEIHSTEPLKT